MDWLAFWLERQEKAKEQIIAYEDAITFLITNPTKSYKLDTGQSNQEVTRVDLGTLQTQLDGLMNRLVTIEARIKGASNINAPAW